MRVLLQKKHISKIDGKQARKYNESMQSAQKNTLEVCDYGEKEKGKELLGLFPGKL